jgi:hypothetical protein
MSWRTIFGNYVIREGCRGLLHWASLQKTSGIGRLARAVTQPEGEAGLSKHSELDVGRWALDVTI